MTSNEKIEADMAEDVQIWNLLASGYEVLASILHSVPSFNIHITPWGCGTEVAWGMPNIASAIQSGNTCTKPISWHTIWLRKRKSSFALNAEPQISLTLSLSATSTPVEMDCKADMICTFCPQEDGSRLPITLWLPLRDHQVQLCPSAESLHAARASRNRQLPT
jgi:hypothetical protein